MQTQLIFIEPTDLIHGSTELRLVTGQRAANSDPQEGTPTLVKASRVVVTEGGDGEKLLMHPLDDVKLSDTAILVWERESSEPEIPDSLLESAAYAFLGNPLSGYSHETCPDLAKGLTELGRDMVFPSLKSLRKSQSDAAYLAWKALTHEDSFDLAEISRLSTDLYERTRKIQDLRQLSDDNGISISYALFPWHQASVFQMARELQTLQSIFENATQDRDFLQLGKQAKPLGQMITQYLDAAALDFRVARLLWYATLGPRLHSAGRSLFRGRIGSKRDFATAIRAWRSASADPDAVFARVWLPLSRALGHHDLQWAAGQYFNKREVQAMQFAT